MQAASESDMWVDGTTYTHCLWLILNHFESDYTPLVNIIGIHFQVRDDYMNLQSTSVCINKDKHDRVRNAYMNFTVYKQQGILWRLDRGQILIPNYPCHQKRSLQSSTVEHYQPKAYIHWSQKYALEVIRKAGSFEYVRQFLRRKEAESLEEIKRLGGNPLLEKYIETIRVEANSDQ